MDQYNEMIKNTMSTILQDSGAEDAEELAEQSLDYNYLHGGVSQELVKQFDALGYEAMMKIALPIAKQLI